MQQIKKIMMTLALLMTAAGAWADNAVPYTVGATDNSGTYRSQNSNTLAIKDGQIATFEFTNNTSGEQAYYNWICEIDNAADEDQALIRADLWENVASSRDNFTYYNYLDMILNNDAATFKAKMQGAKVRLQAIYYQGKITIEATMTPTEGDPLVMVYEKAYTEAQAKILLTIERCHLDITKEEIRTIVPLTRGTGDKADEWTMDGGMPAGNVIVTPEYYPLATADADAVTAATDAAATTDAPLVTVDAAKLTGATALRYCVTETDAAPDYDSDDWKDDVPTAANYTEAKDVYVWFYPVGQSGETDADTYSDGDMNNTGLKVTLLPEPTYNVEFAEGTNPDPDKPEWTATPNTGVKKGETVTVTYSGPERKIIGVKAEKKAKAATLADALVDGATIKVNFKWAGDNTGDYVQGTYSSASGTFTTSKGGSGWAQLVGTQYKVEKDGSTIVIGVCNDSYYMEGTVWTFYVNDNTYEVSYGDNTNKANYGLISVTLNGTDITSQLTEVK